MTSLPDGQADAYSSASSRAVASFLVATLFAVGASGAIALSTPTEYATAPAFGPEQLLEAFGAGSAIQVIDERGDLVEPAGRIQLSK